MCVYIHICTNVCVYAYIYRYYEDPKKTPNPTPQKFSQHFWGGSLFNRFIAPTTIRYYLIVQ